MIGYFLFLVLVCYVLSVLTVPLTQWDLVLMNGSEHDEAPEEDYLYGDLEYDPWSEWIDLGGEG